MGRLRRAKEEAVTDLGDAANLPLPLFDTDIASERSQWIVLRYNDAKPVKSTEPDSELPILTIQKNQL
jgi:hypothetical protein